MGAAHLPTVSVDLKVLWIGDWSVALPGTQSLNELFSSSISSSSLSSSWSKASLRGS